MEEDDQTVLLNQVDNDSFGVGDMTGDGTMLVQPKKRTDYGIGLEDSRV